MMKNENILKPLRELVGDNVTIKESPKSEAEREELLFIDTISTLDKTFVSDNKLHEDYGIDLLGFTQNYYHAIENLIVMLVGYDKADIIWWWICERFAEDGELLGIGTEDGKVHMIKTPKQLYKFLKNL
jgi:hypothetical protein|tara:strand:+ start:192 stop:578 length:387 start_codon:yes stop_codon:yes gene_type:complete